jgi:hypothetical protein
MKKIVFVLFAVSGFFAVKSAGRAYTLKFVGEVPPTGGITVDRIGAMQVLDNNPNEILFISMNQGAICGGGTPASVWKMTLDPGTGLMDSLTLKQSLSQIQSVRGSLFESSDGTLFTGGGWCGYKPPYYSTDSGETWQTADTGVSPPNSTYSYVEFNGDVYAGTGYSPYHGQVYRWLGESGPDNWALVLDLPVPRTVVDSMAVYGGQLFVSSNIYGSGDCNGTVPVYVSVDGTTFNPTTGIPSCYSVPALAVAGNVLVAETKDSNSSTRTMFTWNSTLSQ